MGKRLFVGNIPYSVNESDLRDVFGQTGEIVDVKVVLDRDTGRPRGFAFVEMATEAEAASAIESLNGRDLEGRTLTVRIAEDRGGGGGGGGGGRGFGGGGGGGGGRGGFGGGGGGSQRRW